MAYWLLATRDEGPSQWARRSRDDLAPSHYGSPSTLEVVRYASWSLFLVFGLCPRARINHGLVRLTLYLAVSSCTYSLSVQWQQQERRRHVSASKSLLYDWLLASREPGYSICGRPPAHPVGRTESHTSTVVCDGTAQLKSPLTRA